MFRVNFILFFLLLTGLAHPVLAQKSEVYKAKTYLQNDEPYRALEVVNQALENAANQDEPGLWYYRGRAYLAILQQQEDSASVEKPAQNAYQSFQKTRKTDPESKYYKRSGKQLQQLYKMSLVQASRDIQSQKYEQALQNSQVALKINQDSTAYQYAAYAAEQLQKYDLLLGYYKFLTNNGYGSGSMYESYVYLTRKLTQDTARALAIAEEGVQKYPRHKPLLGQLSQLYQQSGQYDKSLKTLRKLPTENRYLQLKANIFQARGQQDSLITLYQEMIRLDSSNFVAQYNLGALYFRKGEEASGITGSDLGRQYFRKARKHFKQAKAIRPASAKVDRILQKVNQRLSH